MKLNSEFYRLPLTFDAARLKHEVSSFDESEWMPHPSQFPGNSSIPLISVNGECNDVFAGPMKTTPALKKCPYIQQVIASFDEVFGRSRLMRLGAGYEVPEHSDINYHWYSNVRIHIPIITFPEVIFHCSDKHVHMAEGEAWIFDSWKMHKVKNGSDYNRIHLVIDTAGSSKFWDMVSKSEEPHNNILYPDLPTHFLEYKENAKVKIQTENFNVPAVMSPGEIDALCLELISEVCGNNTNTEQDKASYTKALEDFRHNWRSVWSLYGPTDQGLMLYQNLRNRASKDISDIRMAQLLSNKTDGKRVFTVRVLSSCLNIQQKNNSTATSNPINASNGSYGRMPLRIWKKI